MTSRSISELASRRKRFLSDAIELARALGEVIGGARPLRPEDLLPPERASAAADAVPDASDTRADDAMATCRGVLGD